jgi:hypothetical protein
MVADRDYHAANQLGINAQLSNDFALVPAF